MNHLIYQITIIIFGLTKSLKFGLIKKYSKKSTNIIVWFPKFNMDLIHYFGRAYILQDLILLEWVLTNLDNYRFIRVQNLGKLNNCNIYYTFFDRFNPVGIENRSNAIKYNFSNILNNDFYPPIDYLNLWENKIKMHQIFKELNINTPETLIVTESENLNNVNFPILFKHPFLNQSKGIKLLKNKEELDTHLKHFKPKEFILQEVINMTKDLRVVVVNFEIKYHYWRNKTNTTEFTTTSTKFGSKLNVDPIPENIQNIIISYTKKLNLKLAAYDITFENDNLDTHPIVLEVSSSFLLNPIPDIKNINKPYKNYKSNPIRFAIQRYKQTKNIKFLFYDSIRSKNS